MQNEYVEIAAFFYLKLMKEQLQAVSSESQIIVSLGNTQAFKIKKNINAQLN